jgi:hypothetical protein
MYFLLLVDLTGVYFGVIKFFRFEYESVKLEKICSIKFNYSNFAYIHYNLFNSISYQP